MSKEEGRERWAVINFMNYTCRRGRKVVRRIRRQEGVQRDKGWMYNNFSVIMFILIIKINIINREQRSLKIIRPSKQKWHHSDKYNKYNTLQKSNKSNIKRGWVATPVPPGHEINIESHFLLLPRTSSSNNPTSAKMGVAFKESRLLTWTYE